MSFSTYFPICSPTSSKATDYGDPGPASPQNGCVGIETYRWTSGHEEWQKSKIYHGPSPPERCSSESCLALSESADVTVFIVEHENLMNCCDLCQDSLQDAFAFLSAWKEGPYILSNGYFGYQDNFDDTGQSLGFYTWSRFLLQFISIEQKDGEEIIDHKWRDIIPFTYWDKTSNRIRIFFLRTEEKVVDLLLDRILETLRRKGFMLNDPLWPYNSILEEVIRCQHDATFAVRDLIVSEELKRETTGKQRSQADYPRLHQVAKHATTVTEILEVNVRTLECITEFHKMFLDGLVLEPSANISPRLIHQQFMFQSQIVFGVWCRCVSYKDRIKNEIQQTFNLVAQEDARNSVEIAIATKADSRTMASLGIITLIFLPPTFISAVFSTTFFDFGDDPQSWSVSDKIYIYWAFVVPVTILAASIMYRVALCHYILEVIPQYLVRSTRKTLELSDVPDKSSVTLKNLA